MSPLARSIHLRIAIVCAFAIPLMTTIARPVAAQTIINVVTQYGADNTGQTDSTTAIQNALNFAVAQSPKQQVYMPAGTYIHSGVLVDRGVKLYGGGVTTVVKATTPASGAIEMTGNGPQVQSCELTSPTPSSRLQNGDSCAIFIYNASNFTVNAVQVGDAGVQGAAGAGILCGASPCNHGTINYNTVENTLADGIHMGHATNYVSIDHNTMTNTGDDMIACVSGVTDGGEVNNITITNNTCNSQTWGRGITVVGGNAITIDHDMINSSFDGGIYIASESGYNTTGVSGVTVSNSTVCNANTGDPSSGQGGIFLAGRAYVDSNNNTVICSIDNVTCNNVKVINCKNAGVNLGAWVNSFTFENSTINGTSTEGVQINHTSNTTTGSGTNGVVLDTDIIENTGKGGLKAFPNTQGPLTLTNNTWEYIDLTQNTSADVMNIDNNCPGINPIYLSGNSYINTNTSVRDFIYCGINVSKAGSSETAIINANPNTGGKPIVFGPSQSPGAPLLLTATGM